VLNQQVSAGNLPPWGPSELFMVFMPPGISIGAAGYHSDNYTFSAIPNSDTGLRGYNDYFFAAISSSTMSPENTVVASHELAEAVTDPRFDGWFNDAAMATGQGEVADLATPNTGTLSGYQVTQLWSNVDNGIIVPGSTGKTPPPTTVVPNSTVATSAQTTMPMTPTPTVTPTVPPVVAPDFQGVVPVTTKVGKKHKKETVFQLNFSGPLDSNVAETTTLYHVQQSERKGRHGTALKSITVTSAAYNPENNSVTLTLGAYTKNKPLQLSVTALIGANNAPVAPIEAPL
jgi:hypothetical protein